MVQGNSGGCEYFAGVRSFAVTSRHSSLSFVPGAPELRWPSHCGVDGFLDLIAAGEVMLHALYVYGIM